MQNLSLFESYSQPLTLDNHLSSNFNLDIKLYQNTFTSLTETKSYVPISSCVLEHILTTTNLTCYEKLYYILAYSLAVINKNQGGSKSCALPSEDWAKRLCCSRSLVFTMQNSLVNKGYFLIDKDRNELGLNKRNVITPTLPNSVFNNLNEQYPDRIGEHLPYNNAIEFKLAYLDRTKLFIKINYDLLKLITSDTSLNTKQKVIWLNFYIIGYKNYMSQKRYYCASSEITAYYNFSFISSYRELADIFSSNRKDISKSIRALEKLGFIKAQNIYVRKQNNDDKIHNKDRTNISTYDDNIISNYDALGERQDKSLWQITVSLPNEYILELDKIKDRYNLKKTRGRDEFATNSNNCGENYFVLEGIRFNLSSLQTENLKAITYHDKQEQDIRGKLDQDALHIDKSDKGAEGEEIIVTCTNTDNTQNNFNHYEDHKNKKESIDTKFDPNVAKSGLYINKYFKEKIKNIKSNLWGKPKVIFNDFLKELFINSDSDLATHFKTDDSNHLSEKNHPDCIRAKPKEFNIHSEFIRDKLKTLPKDKANKARRFAYSLVSKGLSSGYASSLTKDELAKELIFHAATWKPTKAGSKTREEEIDTALSVAWKAVVSGKWQAPLELAKAQVLEYEFRHYKQKYRESGVLSYEIKSLETEVNRLLGGWYDLGSKIKLSIAYESGGTVEQEEESCKSYDYSFREDNDQNPKCITGNSKLSIVKTKCNNDLECLRKIYHDHQVQHKSLHFFENAEYEDLVSKFGNSNNVFENKLSNDGMAANTIANSVDLSELSEAQNLMVLDYTGTEIIEITTDNKQYFGKIEAEEVGKSGELIMTFIPNTQREFIKSKDTFSFNTDNKILNFPDTSNQLRCYRYNTIESCENNIDCIQEEIKGFKRLDKAVSGIFDKLLCVRGNSD